MGNVCNFLQLEKIFSVFLFKVTNIRSFKAKCYNFLNKNRAGEQFTVEMSTIDERTICYEFKSFLFSESTYCILEIMKENDCPYFHM